MQSNTSTGLLTQLALDPKAQDLLFREARTPNTFTDEPVTDARLEAIHDLLRFAPTSMNQQPLRMVVLRSPGARERLLAHMDGRNREKTAAAPTVLILAADLRFDELLPALFPHAPNAREVFAEPVGRRESARFNATLQIGYFILAARAAGLSVGPMLGFDAAGVDRAFFPDGRDESLLVVNLGQPGPDAFFPRLPRLTFEQFTTFV
ncbi:malonic semialdehyde reductase [Streptomyces sp. NPDC093252]|uniref:malonic semialdehyde reductase n=1 Tax=Streptomyces sp. NPDC093252 TaxID=3154980 RepID=UPI00343DC831